VVQKVAFTRLSASWAAWHVPPTVIFGGGIKVKACAEWHMPANATAAAIAATRRAEVLIVLLSCGAGWSDD
jgi:hypothetical protein